MIKCESQPCSNYEVSRSMWLYSMELARDPKKGELGTGQEIIRIRTRRNGGGIAELHRQVMGKGADDKPVPYFLGLRFDGMRRHVKQFFAAWIRPE
jgi:hypothetical protein